MAKAPSLEHVKFVRAKGKRYAYFNTGQKKLNGRTVYVRMPDFGTPGFYDSYASFKAARTRRETAAYTVAKLAHDYEMSAKFAGLSKGSQVLYSKTLQRISQHLGNFPVDALEKAHVQKVLDHEMSGPGAYNIFATVLSLLYLWGRQRGKTTLEPAKGIEKMKINPHPPWPEHILEAGLRAANDRTRLAIKLLYFTGQRIGDIVSLRWSNISDGTLNIIQQKNGKEVWVPLLKDLKAELAVTPKLGMTILSDKVGRPVTVDAIRKDLQAFTAALGAKTVPHGLRKNAVNALLEAECSVAEVASITGQTYAMVEHYAKGINQRTMAKAAVIKLENRRGTGKP